MLILSRSLCDLNENSLLCRLKYLTAWSPIGGTALGEIRRCGLIGVKVAVLEEVCHMGMAFEVSKAHTGPVLLSICLQLVGQDLSFQLLLKHHAGLPTSMIPAIMVTYSPSEL